MTTIILSYEPAIRFSFFAVIFSLMTLWERAAPRRTQHISRRLRWTNNLLILLIDILTLRLLLPLAAVGFALQIEEQGWGLLNILQLPVAMSMLLAVVTLDFAIYLQHRLFHAVPWFWRLHRMHHADLEFDVTTAVRFHPVEILLSMAIKLLVIFLLGAPALAVLIFEVLLNATSLFNHSNVQLPAHFDRWLRRILVTPEMHRVHHSIRREETNSNFGFNLPWWDHIFKTYRAQPSAGHISMTIGLEDFRDVEELKLHRMLLQPWRSSQQEAADTPDKK